MPQPTHRPIGSTRCRRDRSCPASTTSSTTESWRRRTRVLDRLLNHSYVLTIRGYTSRPQAKERPVGSASPVSSPAEQALKETTNTGSGRFSRPQRGQFQGPDKRDRAISRSLEQGLDR